MHINPNDIGFYVGKKATDEQKYQLLKRCILEENYQYPASGKRNLKFQRKWLFQFSWLSYSKQLDGAVCTVCFLFGQKEVGKGAHMITKSLVATHFNRWKDAKEVFHNHDKLQYHKNALI